MDDGSVECGCEDKFFLDPGSVNVSDPLNAFTCSPCDVKCALCKNGNECISCDTSNDYSEYLDPSVTVNPGDPIRCTKCTTDLEKKLDIGTGKCICKD